MAFCSSVLSVYGSATTAMLSLLQSSRFRASSSAGRIPSAAGRDIHSERTSRGRARRSWQTASTVGHPGQSYTNPAITVAASVEALAGSFPGNLGIELVEL